MIRSRLPGNPAPVTTLVPASQDEDGAARDALIREIDVEGGMGDGVLDGLVRCAAIVCRCPMAAIALVGEEQQTLPVRLGIELAHTPCEGSLCAQALGGDGVTEVADLRSRHGSVIDPIARADPRVRFMACAPFRVGGIRLGTLCVLDSRPRRLDGHQCDVLSDLARAVGNWLHTRHRLQQDQLRLGLLEEVAHDVVGLVVQVHERCDEQVPLLTVEFDNGRMPSLLELERADVERDPLSLLGRVYPEDRPRLLAALERAITSGVHVAEVVRLMRPRGGAAWVSVHCGASPRAGGGRTWNLFVADVGERMRAEAAVDAARRRWQTAVEAAELGLVTISIGSGQVSLDARAAAQHRLADVASRLSVDDWLNGFDLSTQARAALRKQLFAMSEGQTLTLEVALRTPAAADAPAPGLELIAQASVDEQGQLHALGTCRDVTMRLQMMQLRTQKEAAEQASREKTHFLSRVSHELRTPLNAILGFGELLSAEASGRLGPRGAAYLDRIASAGRLLLRLVDELLELQRTAERPLPAQPLDASEATRRSAALLEGVAAAAGVRVATSTPPEPAWALGDLRATEQVLLNLMSNGIKYNRPNGTLKVELRLAPKEVLIAVSDEGEGIPPERLERLFQPFERIGAERSAVQGHGLGLSIAKQLAEAMGGRIEVSSRRGVGTTFVFALQRAPAGTRAPRVAPPPAADRAGGAASPERTATLLLIEDEPVNALLIQEALRKHPAWDLTVALTGAQGLALAREREPSLLLVDINLPDISGLDIVRTLRSDDRTRHLRCVALSADAMPEQIRAARDAGFDAYWTKPVEVMRLPEMIAAQLDLQRSGELGALHAPTVP